VINEMTTVAGAYATAQVFRNGAVPVNPLPVEIAAGMAADLVLAATGAPSSVIQSAPNGDQTNAWRSLGTLSNILAACVRQVGNACGDLFSLTTAPNEAAPTTTLEAIYSIAHHPAANVKPLFALGELAKVYDPYLVPGKHGPDAPDQFLRLDAFTLAIKFNATGRTDSAGNELCPFSGLGNFAFDLNGYVWVTNNTVQGSEFSSTCMIVLKPNGQPADGSGNNANSPIFGGGVLGQGFGLGFAPSGNMWSGNFGWGGDNPVDAQGNPGGSVSEFTRTGEPLSPSTGFTGKVYRVQGVVSDQQGNIWMAGFGNNVVQVFPGGNSKDNRFAFQDDTDTKPFDIRIDGRGDGWVTYQGSSTASKFTFGRNGLQRQFTVPIGSGNNPKGMTIDTKNNAWVTAGAGDAIYAFDSRGNSLGVFNGGGVVGPWGAGADADDIIWVANFGGPDQVGLKYRVSALCGATIRNCPPGLRLGDPITPDTGYTLPSGGEQVTLHNGNPLYYPVPFKSFKPLQRNTAVQPDMAGNLWVTNNFKPSTAYDVLHSPGGDGAVVFIGLAAPVQPVLYSAPISPFDAQ
jgi:hypothetical protein